MQVKKQQLDMVPNQELLVPSQEKSTWKLYIVTLLI